MYIPKFNLNELDGKTLKIKVASSEDGMVVLGIDEEEDKYYLLKHKIVGDPTSKIRLGDDKGYTYVP